MPHLGDYQSVFQLAAALAIGLLALEVFLETPVSRKRPEYQLLLLQIRKVLVKREAPLLADYESGFSDLQGKVEVSINEDFINNSTSTNRSSFVLRGIAIAWAVISCGLLIYSSYGYGFPLNGWELILSILLLALPLGLTIWMLRISAGVLERLERKRREYEQRFIALVDKAWGLEDNNEAAG